jgi:spermidine/putrescine ABC transporter ATP-binding subunit
VDLALSGITKRFGSVVAVDDVSLRIDHGEFLFLLGPSGCGKTTLLRVIAGFEQPNAGHLHFGEREATRIHPTKRNIGMVFQNYALFPHLTVFQNVEFGLKVRRIPPPERRERVLRALELVKLSGLEKRYPRQLSGGQQQRTALARAVVIDPDILLLDEPLGALDRKLRVDMQLELKQLQRQLQLTTVFVTHDQEEALTMADRIAVMRDGQIEQLGTAFDIYEQPASAFVASFIGATNFLHGTVTSVGPALAEVRTPPGQVFTVRSTPEMVQGWEGTFVIRPEKLSLRGATDQQSDRANVLYGRIKDVLYMGDMTHYYVAVDEHTLHVSEQNLSADPHPHAAGANVMVQFDPRSVLPLARVDGRSADPEHEAP